jgi:hypothetical protein
MASESRFSSQQGRFFSLFHNVQVGSEVHATYCAVMSTTVSFSRVKYLGHEADNSPHSSVNVKNCGTTILYFGILLH